LPCPYIGVMEHIWCREIDYVEIESRNKRGGGR
jgi:hypothetical protein